MPLVIGVDAGGSSVTGTTDDTTFTLAGGANLRSLGVEQSIERILRVVKVLANNSKPDVLYVGAAGAGDAALARALKERLALALPETAIAVGDDLRIALRGSIPTGDGVALIAGTGSVAYAEIGASAYRAGGHGYLFGDDGSGYAIGRDALRRTLRAIDCRAPHGALTLEIERRFGANAHEMMERTSGDPRAVAEIAPLVMQFAEQGDDAATEIVHQAADDLCELVKTVLRQAGGEDRRLPLVLSGGLFKEENPLKSTVESLVGGESPLHIVAANEPVVGALALARRLLEHQNA